MELKPITNQDEKEIDSKINEIMPPNFQVEGGILLLKLIMLFVDVR